MIAYIQRMTVTRLQEPLTTQNDTPDMSSPEIVDSEFVDASPTLDLLMEMMKSKAHWLKL